MGSNQTKIPTFAIKRVTLEANGSLVLIILNDIRDFMIGAYKSDRCIQKMALTDHTLLEYGRPRKLDYFFPKQIGGKC